MPIQVVTGLLIKDDKILMCQRHRDKIYPFHWEFPGGKVEDGETLFHALQRELQEELNISIETAKQWFEDIMTYEMQKTYHVTFFVINNFSGELVNIEFEEIRWFSLKQLEDIQHLS